MVFLWFSQILCKNQGSTSTNPRRSIVSLRALRFQGSAKWWENACRMWISCKTSTERTGKSPLDPLDPWENSAFWLCHSYSDTEGSVDSVALEVVIGGYFSDVQPMWMAWVRLLQAACLMCKPFKAQIWRIEDQTSTSQLSSVFPLLSQLWSLWTSPTFWAWLSQNCGWQTLRWQRTMDKSPFQKDDLAICFLGKFHHDLTVLPHSWFL